MGEHDEALDQIASLEGERNAYYHGIDVALHELGVPGDGYPAPVANAVNALKHALSVGHEIAQERVGDD